MKITEIKNLPVRVKLTSGFTLEESYDEGMIIQINSFRSDDTEVYDTGGRCFEVWTTVLPEDVVYNKSVAKRDWIDKDSNPTLDYFEANEKYNKKPDGSYEDKIFVMEEDDFCEIVTESNSTERIKEILNLAYKWGRDNGEGRSEKNFNDMLQTSWAREILK